jgi:hypothetical protein
MTIAIATTIIIPIVTLVLLTQTTMAQTTNPEFNCIYKAAHDAVMNGILIGVVSPAGGNSTFMNKTATVAINKASSEISDCVAPYQK